MKNFRFLILASIAMLGASACQSAANDDDGAGGTGSIGGSGTPVAEDAFADTFAKTYCESIAACCNAAGYEHDTCESSASAFFNGLVALYATPRVQYDAVEAGRCIEAYRKADTACTNRELADALDDACDRVFRGLVSEGGSCMDSFECADSEAGNAYCDTGVCTFDQYELDQSGNAHGAKGDPCNSTCSGGEYDYSCSGAAVDSDAVGACWREDNLYCGDSNTCESLPALGEACGNYSYCATDAHCESGVCVADSASGPCSSGDECLATSYCAFDARQCTPLKANGELCDSDEECTGGQCEQDRCRDWTIAERDSCAGVLD